MPRNPQKQRQVLYEQGRCYRCKKKGHIASQCKLKKETRLADMPVEVLELICDQMVEKDATLPVFLPRACVRNFRSTCRQINSKTLNFFGRYAFATTSVNLAGNGLQRLGEISNHAVFASKVEQITFTWNAKNMLAKRIKKLLGTVDDDSIDPEELAEAQQDLSKTFQRRREMYHRVRSGTEAIDLYLCLQKLPNIRGFHFPTIHRSKLSKKWGQRHLASESGSVARRFSMLVAVAARAAIKLQALSVTGFIADDNVEGLPISALAMPESTLDMLADLRKLDLMFDTTVDVKDPILWPTYLSDFLRKMPKLRSLKLAFIRDWADTVAIFRAIAMAVTFSDLQTLKLDHIALDGHDLGAFLGRHKTIETMSLENLNIMGKGSFAEALIAMSKYCTSLKHFSSLQIAQNNLRTSFESLGHVRTQEFLTNLAPILPYDVTDFQYDETEDARVTSSWCEVMPVARYEACVEEWEGVSERLGLLAQDVQVETTLAQPSYPRFPLDWELDLHIFA